MKPIDLVVRHGRVVVRVIRRLEPRELHVARGFCFLYRWVFREQHGADARNECGFGGGRLWLRGRRRHRHRGVRGRNRDHGRENESMNHILTLPALTVRTTPRRVPASGTGTLAVDSGTSM